LEPVSVKILAAVVALCAMQLIHLAFSLPRDAADADGATERKPGREQRPL